MSRSDVTIRLDTRTGGVREELETIISGIAGLQLLNSNTPAPSDILIHEIGTDLKGEFALIRELAEEGMVGEVFLTAPHPDPQVLIQALRSGAKEFISQPINRDEVERALLQALERRQKEGIRRTPVKRGAIIDVLGSKGGVGATTTAVNLAASLKGLKGDASVALVDMNLLFGEIPLFLDLKPAFSWAEIARNIDRLDASYLMGVLEKHKSGIHVLPPPTKLEGVALANPEVIEKILRLMQEQFDYIVIDSGQSLDPISLKILELSSLVLLLSIPSVPCLINVRRLLETFDTLGYPPESRVRIVMNRDHKKSVISSKEAEEGLQRKISWTIPNDYQTTMSAINQGKLISEISRKCDVSRNYADFAATIAGELGVKPKERSFRPSTKG